MEALVSELKKYDDGYKTLHARDIGKHVQVEYPIIKNNKLLPSAKLVYAFIRLYMIRQTRKAYVSMRVLRKKTGYAYDTINKSIQKLLEHGYLVVEQEKLERDNRFVQNIYYFITDDEQFAQITNFFLESTLLSTREKEFILLLFPFLLPNDRVGSLSNIVDYPTLAGMTGLSINTVRSRMKSLRSKGLVEDAYARISGNHEERCVGWAFDMKAIMLDATINIAEERKMYYYRLKEYGLE